MTLREAIATLARFDVATPHGQDVLLKLRPRTFWTVLSTWTLPKDAASRVDVEAFISALSAIHRWCVMEYAVSVRLERDAARRAAAKARRLERRRR